MTILTEKYRFIKDGLFLCPQLDTETGKQKLVMRKINLESGEIEFEDSIDCIHTAITKIDIDTFTGAQSSKDTQEKFTKNMLDIRSSEKINVINLKPEEKFKAFKSWAAGITENGMDSLKIQNEIEELAKFQYPIANFLMRFLLKTDLEGEFLNEFLNKIEKECIFEGELHESSFIAKLIPVFELLKNNLRNLSNLKKITEKLVEIIKNVDFPIKFFLNNSEFLKIFLQVYPDYIFDYLRKIEHEIGYNNYEQKENLKYLTQVLDVVLDNYYHQEILFERDKTVIKAILSNFNSKELFRDNYRYFFLKAQVIPDLFEKLSNEAITKIKSSKVDENSMIDIALILGFIYIDRLFLFRDLEPNQIVLLDKFPFSKFITKILTINPEFIRLFQEVKSLTSSKIINIIKNDSITKGKLDWDVFSSFIQPIISYFWEFVEEEGNIHEILKNEKEFIGVIVNLQPPLLFYENIPKFFVLALGNIPDFHEKFFSKMKSECYLNGNKDDEKTIMYLRFLNRIWEEFDELLWDFFDENDTFFKEILHLNLPFQLLLENSVVFRCICENLDEKEFVNLIKKNISTIEDKNLTMELIRAPIEERLKMFLEMTYEWDDKNYSVLYSILNLGLPKNFFLQNLNLTGMIFEVISYDSRNRKETSPIVIKILKLLRKFNLPSDMIVKNPNFKELITVYDIIKDFSD